MTIINETSDFDLVKQDPAAWYSQPQAIIDDISLSSAEKYALLEEWAHDLADRSSATDEGMVPVVAGLVDHDVQMRDKLTEAQKALSEMDATPERESLVARIWRRIIGANQPADPAKVTE